MKYAEKNESNIVASPSVQFNVAPCLVVLRSHTFFLSLSLSLGEPYIKLSEYHIIFHHPHIHGKNTRWTLDLHVALNILCHTALSHRAVKHSLWFLLRVFIWEDGSLEILNVTRADEGRYTCFAENDRGKANSTGSLQVTGKSN